MILHHLVSIHSKCRINITCVAWLCDEKSEEPLGESWDLNLELEIKWARDEPFSRTVVNIRFKFHLWKFRSTNQFSLLQKGTESPSLECVKSGVVWNDELCWGVNEITLTPFAKTIMMTKAFILNRLSLTLYLEGLSNLCALSNCSTVSCRWFKSLR